MKKTRDFKRVYFGSEIIQDSIKEFISTTGDKDNDELTKSLTVRFNNESWEHDNFEEFFADFRKDFRSAHLSIYSRKNTKYHLVISVNKYFKNTEITFEAPSRHEIERFFNIYEINASRFFVPPIEEEDQVEAPTIFIGHGRSELWRDLKDHLQDKHKYNVESFESGARAGHVIRDILESMLDESTFAILVLTGEDKTEDGKLRARQNVIHEAGLFQGKLGFNRAIILLEEDTEEFSNISGVQQIRFAKGNIKETFGEILATLKREFEKN
jgi:hypothetical protein